MTDRCPICKGPVQCLSGCSAHARNWYCEDEKGCGWQAWNPDNHTKVQEAKPLSENLKDILRGIDQTETESEDGWWETSTGAEFGANIKTRIEQHVAELEAKLEERDEALAEMRKSRNEHAAKWMNLDAQYKQQQEEIRRLREALLNIIKRLPYPECVTSAEAKIAKDVLQRTAK